MKYIWNIAGLLSLVFALLGAVLPLVPAVPFLLLAAYCFSNGSERLHSWLLNHRYLGPPIRRWKKSRKISKRSKRIIIISICICFAISVAIGLPSYLLLIQAFVFSVISLAIWRYQPKQKGRPA